MYSRDYETVFVPDEDIRSPIPGPTRPTGRGCPAHRRVRFSSLDFDVIGQMSHKLQRAQAVRPVLQSPDVVDLINAFCIRS